MTEYNILDVLPTAASTALDFVASYGDDTYTIFTTNFFINEIYQHFTSRKIRLSDLSNPGDSFIALFQLWAASRSETYARRAYALSIEYEPLENYDRYEERTGDSSTTYGESIQKSQNTTDERTFNNTDTQTIDNTDTRTLENSDELTRGGSDTVKNRRYGVNSTAPVPTTEDETEYNSTDTTTHSGTITDAHDGSITDAHTGTIKDTKGGTITDAHSGTDTTEDSYTLRAHGNIGVTTAAQMLGEDLGALKYDLALIAVCDFMDRYTYTVDSISL